jgi:hypothetical protein
MTKSGANARRSATQRTRLRWTTSWLCLAMTSLTDENSARTVSQENESHFGSRRSRSSRGQRTPSSL